MPWRPPPAIAAAIWFHDAVYDTRRHDNEAASAALARRELQALAWPAEAVEQVAAMVLATAGHAPDQADPDTRLFLDLDLSILGQSPAVYACKERPPMSQLRVDCYTISLDGYGAGVEQSLAAPLGVHGEELHGWMVQTRCFQKMIGNPEGGSTGVDDDFVMRGFENVGAWILGRNMFGPVRGPWPDESWKGWWGPSPPYHVPTFVLTHHARAPIEMEGGTTFHFVTGGIDAALQAAQAAAQGKDVRIGGGASTIRQYLQTQRIDRMHLAVSPVLLGAGESLFQGLDLRALGYECVQQTATAKATHLILQRKKKEG